jgi:hypothetical protein
MREALMLRLGLPRALFRQSNILEIAPGNGQNGLFTASMLPKSFHLVEPNPIAILQITNLFTTTDIPHTTPILHEERFQDFSYQKQFDIIICENWLGCLPEEQTLLKKIQQMLCNGGTLIMTFSPISGLSPNIIRKILSLKILDNRQDFSSQTQTLLRAFGPHLSTIKHMNRSRQDWIKDCMLNPHYLNVILPLKKLFETVGDGLTVLSVTPSYSNDWRWFKQLDKDKVKLNDNLQIFHDANVLNFIDYQTINSPLSINKSELANSIFENFHLAALECEKSFLQGEKNTSKFAEAVFVLVEFLKDNAPTLSSAFLEAANLLSQEMITHTDITEMREFTPIFGRETHYIALTK